MDKQMKISVVLSAYDKMSAVVNASVDKAQRRLKGLQKAQGGLNSFGNAAAIGGGIATAAFASTIKAAEESEQAGNRLKQVFKSMGEQNDNAANKALDFANKLQMQIGVEDELIAATQAKIATFKTVSNETARMAGIFDRATAAAFDMQATGFGEASQNAVQLGKALEDPIKGITSLRKSGITFTEAERKKIQALVDSGNKLKAQNLILAAVEKQVGGVAKATVTGTKKAKVAWSEVSESVGKMLLPKLNQLAGILVSKVIPKVQGFIDKHPGLVKFMAAASVSLLAVGVIAKGLAFGISGLTTAVNISSTAFKFLGTTFKFVGRIFLTNPIGIVITLIALGAMLIIKYWDKIKAFFVNLWNNVKAAFSRFWNWVKEMAAKYNPHTLIMKAWDKIKNFFSDLWGKVKESWKKGWENLKNILKENNPMKTVYALWEDIVKWFQQLWDKVKNIFSNAWKGIKNGIKSLFGGNSEVDNAVKKTTNLLDKTNKATINYAVVGTNAGNYTGTASPAAASALQPNAVNNSTNNMQFSPTINLSGGATKEDAKTITDALAPSFKNQMKQYQANQERVKY